MLPVVALVGRPNVGKSTLYNSLTKSRDAIVSDMPGVTRDRLFGICRRGERPFMVVDTAGLTENEDVLAKGMAAQSWQAIEESDLVCLVVDARDGINPDDLEIAQRIRTTGRPMMLVVNKIDGVNEDNVRAEFSRLGIAATLLISAAHNQGINDFVEEVLTRLPPDAVEPEADDGVIRIAIIGRPNVGKSTLVNRLLGEERVLAMDLPGTTRDAVRVPLERDGRKYLLIDTAGIRRKARVGEGVEKFSVIKALQAAVEAHVVILMLDAQQGFADQDAHLLGEIVEAGRGLVLAMNKWDGLSVRERTQVNSRLDWGLSFVNFAKRLPISALHGSGLGELMKAVNQAHKAATREFSANELTKAINEAFEKHQPPMVRGRVAKMRYAHQGGRNPPRVIIHGSRLKDLPDAYKRYLENFLRDKFRLTGTPLALEFREGANPYADKKNVLTPRQVEKRRRLMRHVKKG
ncbi:MAG: ribosome biogenesis GTPase Der [Rhodanobacteraceae bacterium]|mgnify:CR=1 FL=1|nr:ribosome biogenesis GTPase Der [Rhodanobacteraceae bacterium]